MKDQKKTKDQLLREMDSLRRRLAELEAGTDTFKSSLISVGAEKVRADSILAGMVDGVSIQGLDHIIIYQNRILKDLLGDNTGEYCYKAYAHKDTVCEDCPAVATLKDGKIHTVERTISTSKGECQMEVTLSPLRDGSGEIIGSIKVYRDISGRKKMEDMLRGIAQGVSATTGDAFFISLAGFLATTLDVDYVIIAELLKDKTDTVRTLAFFDHGDIADNFEYSLSGTPCENVVKQELRCYPQGIQSHFPDNSALARMSVESFVGTPLHDSSRNVIGIINVMDSKPLENTDIAESLLRIFAVRSSAELERKQAEDRLRESEERHSGAFRHSAIGKVLVDLDGAFIQVNPAFCKMLGYGETELTGKKFQDITHPDDIATSLDVYSEVLNGAKASIRFEKRYTRKDGSVAWGLVNITRHRGVAGELLHFIVEIQDITEFKRSSEALLDSETRYRDLFENARDAIFIVDENLRYIDVNRRASEIFGYSREEFLKMGILDVIPQEQIPLSKKEFRDLRERGNYENFVGKIRTKDGRWLDIEVNSSAIFEDGRFVGSRDIVRDITKQKRDADRIREAEARYRTLFEQSPDGIVLIDSRGALIDFNEATHRQLGYTREEFAGLRISDIDPFETEEEIRASIEKALNEGKAELEVRHRTKDGEIRNVLVVTKTVQLGNEKLLHTIWRDITEHKKMEEELLKIEKLESLGVLAGGIAHDFKNLLVGILGNISLARLNIASRQEAHERLIEAEKACLAARELTHQLLTFSRSGDPMKRTVSITEIVRDSCTFCLSGSAVRCEYEFSGDVWPVEIDAGQIGQVFHNLIINADQAMPNGGALKIKAGNITVNPESILPLKPGQYVKISLEDRGVGIKREHIQKIFDPYFTTKQKGSGLGLASAYSIIKKHGGHIEVHSEPDVGTVFSVYLQAIPGGLTVDEPRAGKTVTGVGRILLMDDEEIVRIAAVKMLEHLGYEVICAENGEEAIDLFRQAVTEGRPFDAVVLDLTVRGGMGGRETNSRLHALDPQVRTIVFSGYSEDPIMANYRKYGFSAYLSKPCEIVELSVVLDEVLKKGT